MSENVYIVMYNGRWPEDGSELGGVYADEETAKEAAKEQRCSELEGGWYNAYVLGREVRSE